MSDEPSGTDRAMELFVYGPIGLAAYLRDTTPSFLRLFVSRGRAIIDGQRRSAGGQLANARAVGEFASVQGAPQVRQAVGDALAVARARTEEALDYLSALAASVGGAAPAPPRPAPAGGRSPTFSVAPSAPDDGAHLAIRDYDELSATQVVERLDGLSQGELDAIRTYEAGHRARNTVLGKIERLQRPAG